MALNDGIRGLYRIESAAAAPRPPAGKPAEEAPPAGKAAPQKEGWLKQSRKLIPGEALAGYLSFQALANAAADPMQAQVFLALVFLVVTLFLRYVGSQQPGTTGMKSVQWSVVFISGFSFVFLVYASGGQIWWHEPIPDQKFYAQILAFALGVIGPYLTKSAPSTG